MTTKYKSISVFFPAYNEEANVKKSVLQIKAVIEKLFNKYEIIVINDGSSDDTGKIADKLSEKYHQVKVVHHNSNRGYGGALISGFNKAQYDLVFFTDADLQFDLKEITKLLKFIDNYDVVIGYRKPRRDPFMRLVNAWGWKWLNYLLFGLRVRDIDCAFKLFTKKAIKSINIKSFGAMVSAEFLIKLKKKGYSFKEIPVSHLPRNAGNPTGAKPYVIIKAFKELWDFYLKQKKLKKEK